MSCADLPRARYASAPLPGREGLSGGGGASEGTVPGRGGGDGLARPCARGRARSPPADRRGQGERGAAGGRNGGSQGAAAAGGVWNPRPLAWRGLESPRHARGLAELVFGDGGVPPDGAEDLLAELLYGGVGVLGAPLGEGVAADVGSEGLQRGLALAFDGDGAQGAHGQRVDRTVGVEGGYDYLIGLPDDRVGEAGGLQALGNLEAHHGVALVGVHHDRHFAGHGGAVGPVEGAEGAG